MDDLTIRPYEPGDRAAVRHVCCETADAGDPVEGFFSDRELIADLATRYYTDFEPETSWVAETGVAETGGSVVGYLTGSVDTKRFERVTSRRIAGPAIAAAIRRGALRRRETWRMLSVLPRILAAFAGQRRRPLEMYPAHLHLNILRESRGRHAGGQLLRAFMERLRVAGIRGVHATVRGDNAAGRSFFEHQGFAGIGGYTIVLYYGKEKRHVPIIVYGRTIETRESEVLSC